MRRVLIIVGLLVLLPVLEIVTLIGIGQWIGGWPTFVLVLATSVLGVVLLWREGGKAWRAFREALADGEPPGPTATEGLLVLVGGIFMVIPGFISDIIGILLIAPPTRRVARALVLRYFSTRMSPRAATTLIGPTRARARQGPTVRNPPPTPTAPPPLTTETVSEPIEGEIIDPR